MIRNDIVNDGATMTSLQKSASTSNCDYKKLAMRYQMDGTIDPRPKRGPDVKIIIQSLQLNPVDDQQMAVSRSNACNPAKMFKSVIQRANDSGSMDTSLEYKPLSTIAENKNGHSLHRKMPYVDELREILKKNQNFQSKSNNAPKNDGVQTPSKLPFANRKNLPQTPIDCEPKNNSAAVPKVCEQYVDSVKLKKKMPMSSTPYRAKADNETNNNCKSEINLMTPAADVRFIDADCEKTDGEINKTLVKCFSLTRASCRRMASFRKNLRKQGSSSEIFEQKTSPKFERRTLFTSSLNSKTNRSSVVLPDETSPLRRQKNIKVKNSKLLNFFRPSKVNEEEGIVCSKHESNLSHTCNNLTQLLAKSDQIFDELGCVPLLTKDNLDYHTCCDDDMNESDQTICWGDKFEFSFLCEPSTSDIEEDFDDDIGSEYFPSVENTKFPNIPFVKVSPPSSIETNECQRSNKDATNNFDINSSSFRRSVSDPALIRLSSAYTNNNIAANSEFTSNDPFNYFKHASGNAVSGLFRNIRMVIKLFTIKLEYLKVVIAVTILLIDPPKNIHDNGMPFFMAHKLHFMRVNSQ